MKKIFFYTLLLIATTTVSLVAQEKTPYIIGADQNQTRIVILDSQMEWSKPESIKWEWSATTCNELSQEHKKWFKNISEVKCVKNGTHILANASGGASILIRLADKKIVYYVFAGGNTHSSEILPDGNLVTASSTGNYLRIFSIPSKGGVDPEKVYSVKIPMDDAHGVVWDTQNNILHATGKFGIIDFKYNFNKSKPMLEKIAEYPVYEDKKPFKGHDLYPVRGEKDKLFVTGHDVRIFDTKTHTYEIYSNIGQIKSIDKLPNCNKIIASKPQEKWWTDSVISLEQESFTTLNTLPKAKFYKLRWFLPFD